MEETVFTRALFLRITNEVAAKSIREASRDTGVLRERVALAIPDASARDLDWATSVVARYLDDMANHT
jgi:hypothetical protein